MWPRTGVTFGMCGRTSRDGSASVLAAERVCRNNGSSRADEPLTLSSVVDGVNPSGCDELGLLAPGSSESAAVSSSTRDGTLEALFNIFRLKTEIVNGRKKQKNGMVW